MKKSDNVRSEGPQSVFTNRTYKGFSPQVMARIRVDFSYKTVPVDPATIKGA